MAYSGLTPTIVLRYLNRMMGISVQDLEITDDEMMRIVFQESLPTYSKFFPYYYRLLLTSDDVLDSKRPNTYKMPNDDNLEIFGIHRIWLDNMNQFGGSLLPLVNDPYTSQLLNDYLSATITPVTWDFYAPDIITIRPKIEFRRSALVEVKAVHPTHMKTIPVSMRDEFLRLCLDDVLISLYPIRHRFNSINSPYGNIEVFTEMVDNAQSDKQDLLNGWKENLLRQGNAKRIWIS